MPRSRFRNTAVKPPLVPSPMPSPSILNPQNRPPSILSPQNRPASILSTLTSPSPLRPEGAAWVVICGHERKKLGLFCLSWTEFLQKIWNLDHLDIRSHFIPTALKHDLS